MHVHLIEDDSPLPLQWERVTLPEICKILDSARVPINTSERNKRVSGKTENELYPYYGATGQVGLIDNFLFDGEHVLLGEDGAPFLDPYKNKSYIVSSKFWVNNHAHILKAFISNKYISYFLNSIDYAKYVTGTTRLKLTLSLLKTIKVPFPPKNEQHRIVAKIEELFSLLDEAVAGLKRAQAQLKVYRQALLKAAFSGELTKAWREEHAAELETAEALLARIKVERAARYRKQLASWQAEVQAWEDGGKTGKKPSKPQAPKELPPLSPAELAGLPELPKGWGWVRLGIGNLDVFDGPFGSNLKSCDYTDSGVRVIRLENIGQYTFNDSKKTFITEEKYETISEHTVSSGDIIFSSFIADETRVVILPDYIVKAVNKADCFCVRNFGDSIDAKYLANYLSTRFVYHMLESLVHGATRPRINTTQLKQCPTPVCGISEQKEVIQNLETAFLRINEMSSSIELSLLHADALRQAILKKAFSGRLVPQDPGDEPAAVLLERIRDERAALSQDGQKRTRRP